MTARFLKHAHLLGSVPLLGVNSSKSSSFGHFCIADRQNLNVILDRVERDDDYSLPLIAPGASVERLALAGTCFERGAGVSPESGRNKQYIVEIRGQREEQRSSGIWIGPPAGLTGSLRSAGGVVLPITDRRFQYLVREPCIRPAEKWRFLSGIMGSNEEIRVLSKMRSGILHIDGQHIIGRLFLVMNCLSDPATMI